MAPVCWLHVWGQGPDLGHGAQRVGLQGPIPRCRAQGAGPGSWHEAGVPFWGAGSVGPRSCPRARGREGQVPVLGHRVWGSWGPIQDSVEGVGLDPMPGRGSRVPFYGSGSGQGLALGCGAWAELPAWDAWSPPFCALWVPAALGCTAQFSRGLSLPGPAVPPGTKGATGPAGRALWHPPRPPAAGCSREGVTRLASPCRSDCFSNMSSLRDLTAKYSSALAM